jgi:hypothetical protein
VNPAIRKFESSRPSQAVRLSGKPSLVIAEAPADTIQLRNTKETKLVSAKAKYKTASVANYSKRLIAGPIA